MAKLHVNCSILRESLLILQYTTLLKYSWFINNVYSCKQYFIIENHVNRGWDSWGDCSQEHNQVTSQNTMQFNIRLLTSSNDPLKTNQSFNVLMSKFDKIPDYWNFVECNFKYLLDCCTKFPRLSYKISPIVVQNLSDCRTKSFRLLYKISTIVVQNLPDCGNFVPIMLNVILNISLIVVQSLLNCCTKSPWLC